MKYLNRKEAAARIGVLYQTLANWASDPEMQKLLPFRRNGRRVEYAESDIKRFIETRITWVGK